MKISGAELRDFISHGWPGDDWYWDVDLFDDLPDALPLASETYDIQDLDDLKWQGEERRDPLPIGKAIKTWRKQRDYDFCSVTIPKGQVAAFREMLAAFGGKIEAS